MRVLSPPLFPSFLPSATREPVSKLGFGPRRKRSISFPEPVHFWSAVTEGQVRFLRIAKFSRGHWLIVIGQFGDLLWLKTNSRFSSVM